MLDLDFDALIDGPEQPSEVGHHGPSLTNNENRSSEGKAAFPACKD